MIDILHLLGLAEYAALQAGRKIMDIHRSGRLDISAKPDASPLTRADKAAHAIISAMLVPTELPVLSEEAVEADYLHRKKWDYYWIIDPLDGTKEFINGSDEFTVNIALMKKTTPVGGIIHVPASRTTYVGSTEGGVWKKQDEHVFRLPAPLARPRMEDLKKMDRITVVVSRSHLSQETMEFVGQFHDVRLVSRGSSLKFMMLVEGAADIYPRFGTTMEWDTAAAHAILHAANRGIYTADVLSELQYNKQDLRNPYFIAY